MRTSVKRNPEPQQPEPQEPKPLPVPLESLEDIEVWFGADDMAQALRAHVMPLFAAMATPGGSISTGAGIHEQFRLDRRRKPNASCAQPPTHSSPSLVT
jgi:hypothetical protein